MLAVILFSLLERFPASKSSRGEAEPKEGLGTNPVTSLKHLELELALAEANTEVNKLTPSSISFFFLFPFLPSFLSSFFLPSFPSFFFFFCLKPLKLGFHLPPEDS